MERFKEKGKIVLESLLPAFITMVIFLVVLYYNGIFPFGENLIDYYDMGQTNAPLYYHIWDFLHGCSALFFDWYIDLGQNLAMGSAIQWNISPFNLYFLLIPRELVYRSLSVYMGIHLFFMAFNMALFIKALCPGLKYHFRIIAAITYSLCGYTLTHYTIPTYLDTAVYFPLLAIAVLRLLRGKGRGMYILMLGFTTALSYYLGFMHLIYILLFSGSYILLIKKTEERKRTVSDLFVGTVSGILLSSFMLLPSVMEMTGSSRFNSNLSEGLPATLISILNSIGADEYYVKFLQLHAMEIFVILIIAGAIHYRKDRRHTAMILLGVFIPCALMVFESINILWHFGTYYHYPIRCGYLIPFAILSGAACFYERFGNTADDRVSATGIIISTAVSELLIGIYLHFYFSHEVWEITDLFNSWVITSGLITGTIVACMFLIMKLKKYNVILTVTTVTKLFFPVLFTELLLGGIVGYGTPYFTDSFFEDPEQSGDYILKAEAFEEAASDYFDRGDQQYRVWCVKNPDTELNTNYGMVIRHGTITGWANTVSRETLDTAEKLGYSTHFMRILDSGGTLLTDSVLQVRDIIDCSGYFDEIEGVYKKIEDYDTEMGRFSLYHNECYFPFAFGVTDGVDNISFKDNSITDNNNMLYHILSGEKDDIASVIKASELPGEQVDHGSVNVELNVDGRKALYLSRGRADAVFVNGKPVHVPTIGDMDNTAYPAWFNSNLLMLGEYENETVNIECPETSRLILLDIDKFIALAGDLQERSGEDDLPEAGLTDIKFGVHGDEIRNRALIPIAWSPGWTATVDGEKTAIYDVGGLFMSIPIHEGHNTVYLRFVPPGLYGGIIITLLTIILIFVFSFNTKAADAGNRLLNVISPYVFYVFMAVFTLAALALYVIPICWTVIHVILKRII